MIKVITIIGTRPEAIKIAILHKLLLENDNFDALLCTTGQHGTLVDEVLQLFNISSDILLDNIKEDKYMSSTIAVMIGALQKVFGEHNPDLIIVQGDTLSSFCGSLVAFLNKIPLAHIEAGLRTQNKWGPFPEEIFRKFNDITADFLFAPTPSAYKNLIDEGISPSSISITGNTSIDALVNISAEIKSDNYEPPQSLSSLLEQIYSRGKTIGVLTMHRRESLGDYYLDSLKKIDKLMSDKGMEIIYPVHPNPKIQNLLAKLDLQNFHMIDPLPYDQFIWLMMQSKIIFTDSGGVQEEAPYLGKTAIVLRNESERNEAIEKGYNYFYDNMNSENWDQIINPDNVQTNLYGDGLASQKIISILEGAFKKPNLSHDPGQS